MNVIIIAVTWFDGCVCVGLIDCVCHRSCVQLITAKLTQVSANMPSSPDSSSDSSTGSPGNHGNHYSDGPNPEVESCLPGVVS